MPLTFEEAKRAYIECAPNSVVAKARLAKDHPEWKAQLAEWDESKHPRNPAGTGTGGEFASTGLVSHIKTKYPHDKADTPRKNAENLSEFLDQNSDSIRTSVWQPTGGTNSRVYIFEKGDNPMNASGYIEFKEIEGKVQRYPFQQASKVAGNRGMIQRVEREANRLLSQYKLERSAISAERKAAKGI